MKNIQIGKKLASRVTSWLAKGLDKVEKEELLTTVPRKGQVSLEPPVLNQELIFRFQPNAISRDGYFVGYQTVNGVRFITHFSL